MTRFAWDDMGEAGVNIPEYRHAEDQEAYARRHTPLPGQRTLWDESKHPRGQPENAGEFASKSGASAPAAEPAAQPQQQAQPQIDHASDYQKNGTRSAAFKAWFGDWENDPSAASRVVNEEGEPQETSPIDGTGSKVSRNGKPISVYHGTAQGGFDQFNKEKLNPGSLYGPGFYFTEDSTVADEYQEKDRPYSLDRPLTAKDMKTAERWFNSAQVQRDARSDIGIREHLRDLYNAWKSGPERFAEEIAKNPDQAILRKLNVSRVAKGSPEVKQVFLNIRQPVRIDEAISRQPEIVDRMRTAALSWMDSGEWNPISGNGFGGPPVRTPENVQLAKNRLNQFFDGYRGSAYTPEDLLASITNYIHSDNSYRFNRSQWPKFMAAAGYDGMTHIGGNNIGNREHRVWIAFEPTQIKAVDNRGTFDPADPRINYSAANWAEDQHPRGQPENAGQFSDAPTKATPQTATPNPAAPTGKPAGEPAAPKPIPRKIQQMRRHLTRHANGWQAVYQASRATRSAVSKAEEAYDQAFSAWQQQATAHDREFDAAHAQWEKDHAAWEQAYSAWEQLEDPTDFDLEEPEEPEHNPPEEPDAPDLDKIGQEESVKQYQQLKKQLKQFGFSEEEAQEMSAEADNLTELPDRKAAQQVTERVTKVHQTVQAAEAVWQRLQEAKKDGIDPDDVLALLQD